MDIYGRLVVRTRILGRRPAELVTLARGGAYADVTAGKVAVAAALDEFEPNLQLIRVGVAAVDGLENGSGVAALRHEELGRIVRDEILEGTSGQGSEFSG